MSDRLDSPLFASLDPRSERREDLAARFPGQWVAVSNDWSQLYAHGASYLAVCDGARSAGARDPLVTRLRSGGL